MATAHPTSLREIAKPTCKTCGIGMWLLRIEPLIACDRLTFECARCGTQQQQEIAPGNSLPKLR